MNPVIQRRLDQTAQQLQFAQAIRSSAILFTLTTFALLLLGAAIKVGLLANRQTASWLFTIIAIGGLLLWIITLFVKAILPVAPQNAARETERISPGLMDRLHTLMAVASERNSPQVDSYARRIEQQSVHVITADRSRVPLVSPQSFRWITAWLTLTAITLLFFRWTDPFAQLSRNVEPEPVAQNSNGLESLPPKDPATREPALPPWIETRVLEPGHDLVVTRYETIPMLIEAATSGELDSVSLHMALNSDQMPEQRLPLGADRKFTRNQELFDPEPLGAGDWDVFAYYASARSVDGMQGGSRIYFIEIRPFREELEQIPGGVTGEPYRLLNELTNMVNAQQDSIRAAHRMAQTPDRIPAEMPSQLAQAQETLRSAVHQLRSNLPETEALAPAAARLDQATEAFDKTADLFRTGQYHAAEESAQRALGQLAASRKDIHQAVRQDPAAIPDSTPISDPLADMSGQFENWSEAQTQLSGAADHLKQLVEDERKIVQQIKPCKTEVHQQGAEQQQGLMERFEQFQRDNAAACKRAGAQSAQAQNALQSAGEAIDQLAAKHDNPTHGKANRAATQAVNALLEMEQALRQQAANRQAAAARQLQQALDQQIQALERIEQEPDSATSEQLQQLAKNMQRTTDEIKKMAEDPSTRDQFTDQLRELLNDENKERLDKQ